MGLNDEQRAAAIEVLSAPPAERQLDLATAVAETRTLAVLVGEDGALAWVSDGHEEGLAVWPYLTVASLCCQGEWSDLEAREATLEEVLALAADRGGQLSISPGPDAKGFLTTCDEFIDLLARLAS
ncbi:MAG: DUF2750 domain-containing protein [Actinobacteria bacterium]|nr:DUF2750 domain-containing protein [Actinomycetota bacterium]